MAKFLHAKYPPTISTARKTERYERAAEYSGGSGGGAIVRISAAAVICEADGRTGTAHSRRVRISVGSHRRTRHPVLVLSSSLTRSRCLLFVLTHGHGQESWLSTPNDGLVRALPVDTVLPEPSTLRNTAALRASAPGRPIASGFVRICPNGQMRQMRLGRTSQRCDPSGQACPPRPILDPNLHRGCVGPDMKRCPPPPFPGPSVSGAFQNNTCITSKVLLQKTLQLDYPNPKDGLNKNQRPGSVPDAPS
jgi:hypothetical protein